MNIISWNVNGLRAVLNKGAWDWIRSLDPDVVCLQEIKARPEQLTEEQQQNFQGYHAHWNPAQRPGYSGVATFVRQPPLEVGYGLGLVKFDPEGRLIRTRYPGFSLYNVYFPSGQRDYGRVTYKLEFYEKLLEVFDRMHSARELILVCGDFNTAHREIDLRNPRQNVKTSGFLPEERVWIDRYLEHGFVDVFRYLYPEKVQYTWWSAVTYARERNVGWRLDYFMASKALTPLIEDIIIHDDVLGSDHCPVELVIKMR